MQGTEGSKPCASVLVPLLSYTGPGEAEEPARAECSCDTKTFACCSRVPEPNPYAGADSLRELGCVPKVVRVPPAGRAFSDIEGLWALAATPTQLPAQRSASGYGRTRRRRPMRRGLRCAERHGTLSRVSMQSEPGGPDRTARAVARTEQRSRKSEPTCQSTKNTNHCVTARNHRPCADSTTSPVHNTPPHSPKAALTRCTSHQAHTTRTRKKGLTTVSACLRLPRLHIPQQERPMEADADAAHRGPNLAARASRRSASPGSDASMPPATSW